MHFSWPWVFLLLPVPLLLRAPIVAQRKSLRVPPQLESALNQSKHTRPALKSRMLWLWLAWCLLLLTLSQPWIPGDTSVQPVSGRALTLAVDVSASMERQDFSLDGVQSDRLSVVKQVAHDFVLARCR